MKIGVVLENRSVFDEGIGTV